jgi:hypothetical protein
MVHIFAYIVKVVVLTSSADALLRVCGTLQFRKRVRRVDLSNEDGLELVHSSIDEQESGIVVRYHWRGLHESVSAFLFEVLNECLTD